MSAALLRTSQRCPTVLSVLVPFAIFNKPYRNGKVIDEDGSTYLLTDEKHLVKNTEAFKQEILFLHSILKNLGSIKIKMLKEALHDIQTIQGHNVQEIYQVIPYDFFVRKHQEAIESITEKVRQNPSAVAYALFHIAKNNKAIDAQLTILRLHHGLPFPLQIEDHDVQKVLLNVYHKFANAGDFNHKNLKVEIGNDTFYHKIDFETFSAALIPLFENLVKYSANHSTLVIDFLNENGIKKIKFDMMSLELDPGEEIKIFEKNFSGINAHKFHIAGSGLGMYNTKRLLEQNNIDIKIRVEKRDEKRFMIGEIPYTNNILEITFPY